MIGMNQIPAPAILAILAILVIASVAAGCTAPATEPDTADMTRVARGISASVNAGLDDIKAGLGNTSATLAATGLSGRKANAVLADNLLRYPWTLSSFAFSPGGVVLAAAPENCSVFIGANLSWQPGVQKANAVRVPAASGVFPMVEGFSAMLQTCPVFSSTGEYLGYADITYRPEVFFGQHIGPLTNGTEYDVWVVQTDGTEVYDTTPAEIGKNILTDPAYADPALREIATRIVNEPSGTGTYTFWNREWNRNVTKRAAWETAGIDGTEWRVVVTRETGTSP
jgi:hypothetical protein